MLPLKKRSLIYHKQQRVENNPHRCLKMILYRCWSTYYDFLTEIKCVLFFELWFAVYNDISRKVAHGKLIQ